MCVCAHAGVGGLKGPNVVAESVRSNRWFARLSEDWEKVKESCQV